MMSARRTRAHVPQILSASSLSASTRIAVSLAVTIGCSAPPGTVLPDDDGPVYGGGSPGALPGASGTGNLAPPGSSPPAPVTTPMPGEQSPAINAPIANAGSGGSAPVGTASTPGSAGAGGAPVSPVAPPPGSDVSPEEIASFFASLPCGANYTALGDGGWLFCLRLSDAGAACTRGTAEFQRVTYADGSPVTNVAQVSGQRDGAVGVVTADGALHVGGVTGISSTPLIASGVINYSAGYHASVALVEQGAGFGVLSWTDNGAPAPVTLPDGAQPIQVSANYGLACALGTTGAAYCWNAGGNHGLPLTDAPTRMPLARPVQMISVGQNSVCGVSFGGTLECQAAWYDSPYLPTEGSAPNFQVRQSTFPSIRLVHAGFKQGIIVRSDGTAVYLPGGAIPPNDNPGQPFTGLTNIVAAGGDRGSACVQNDAGAVFCHNESGFAQATLGGAPLTARAADCPL